MDLPSLPKALRSFGAARPEEAYSRIDQWAKGVQALLGALRERVLDLIRRMSAVEEDLADLTEVVDGLGGGGSVTFGSPVALTPGGSNVDGVSTDAARADHEHELPPFGNGAGEFCEGDDARLSDDRTASGLRTATTVVDVASSAAPAAGDILVANSTTDATWQPPSAIMPTLLWSADVPPASPHASDEEFETDASGTPGSMGNFDPGSILGTVSTSAHKLVIVSPSSGSTAWAGVLKAVPGGGEWCVYAKINASRSGGAVGDPWAGILLTDSNGQPGGGAESTAAIRAYWWQAKVTENAASGASYATYNGGASAATLIHTPAPPYVRVRVNGSTISHDVSWDGNGWTNISSGVSSITPAYVGVGHRRTGTNVIVRVSCDFLRFFSGSGSSVFDANAIGGYYRVGEA